MVVRLSSLMHRAHLPPGNTPGTHFCYRLSQPQGHSVIRSYVDEKFHDTILERTSDLLICSAVPKPLCYRSPPKVLVQTTFTYSWHLIVFTVHKDNMTQITSNQQQIFCVPQCRRVKLLQNGPKTFLFVNKSIKYLS
jgi:hypothetical protein